MDTPPPQRASHVELSDGVQTTIRPLQPRDTGQIVELYRSLTDDERYFRFFTLNPAHLQKSAQSLTEPSADQYSIGAFAAETLLGVANYVKCDPSGYAEAAVVVAHTEHFRGVGTALLLSLGKAAMGNGIHHLVADVLAENHPMLHVIADSGWPCRRHLDGSVLHIEIDLDDVV
jgi:L-amino acid N-acyltransferase YncA